MVKYISTLVKLSSSGPLSIVDFRLDVLVDCGISAFPKRATEREASGVFPCVILASVPARRAAENGAASRRIVAASHAAATRPSAMWLVCDIIHM